VVTLATACTAAAASATGGVGAATPAQGPILYGGGFLCPYADRDPTLCDGKPLYNGAIFMIPRPGAASRRITSGRFDDSRPAWSPDRRRIAFARSRSPATGFQIWVMNADGTGARRITSGTVDTEPSWSPDGRWIAFRGGTGTFDVFVVRPDGSGLRNVTKNPYGIHALTPAWSRDGSRIAFQRVASGPGTGIYSVGVDGRGLRRLARDGYQPDWSPDGRRIVYIHRDPAAGPGCQIYAMGPNGGGKRRVTRRDSWGSPTWSPDSRWLVAIRNDRLTLMRADGSGVRPLTTRRVGFLIDGISW
jgi:TolB protein